MSSNTSATDVQQHSKHNLNTALSKVENYETDQQSDKKDEMKRIPDDDNALENLERIVGIPRDQFLLLIKTFSYILRRIGTYLIRPSVLQTELRDTLQLIDEAKIDVIIRLWNRETAPLIRNLATKQCEQNQVVDVAWKLNVEISSQCQQRQKNALAMLQLRTEAGDDLNLEMNHSELYQLYRQFEEIQAELDSLLRDETKT